MLCYRRDGRKGTNKMEMRVLSVINLKGGVAKTISSVAIAHLLAGKGFRVLLVDNDKQGDASRGYRRRDEDGEGIDKIMTARRPDMGRLIQHTDFPGLDIITANMKLLKANLEVLLDQTRQQQTRLKKALEQVRDQYDFCIIDNAPDINISTINALVASNDVIVPLEVDDNTTEGLAELAEQIEFTREDLNPGLTFRGCFITKYDKRNDAHAQGAAQLEASGKYPVFKTKIRTSRKVSESTFARLPITVYSKRSNAAIDYTALVEEYLDALRADGVNLLSVRPVTESDT